MLGDDGKLKPGFQFISYSNLFTYLYISRSIADTPDIYKLYFYDLVRHRRVITPLING